MNYRQLRGAIDPALLARYDEHKHAHDDRKCGPWPPCACDCMTCRNDPLCSGDMAEPPTACPTCGGSGELSTGLLEDRTGHFVQRKRKCPDCDILLTRLGPGLLWDVPVAYEVERLPRTKPMQRVRDWLAGGTEVNPTLVLSGPLGTGKTFTAVAVGRALCRRELTVEFCTVPDLLADLRSSIAFPREDRDPEQYVWRAKQADVLVLDDLGAERATEFATETLFRIIDARYRGRRRLVVTTNVTSPPEGHRIWDRLLDRRLSHVVLLTTRVRGKARP